jgi:hypothetical protein
VVVIRSTEKGKAVEVLGAKGTVADAFDIILPSHEI